MDDMQEWAKQQAVDAALYDIARNVTDEVMGEGTYAEINGGNPDPGVQATIERGRQGYHGRLWDSPMTDGMRRVDMTGATCVLCEEEIGEHDDGLRQLQDYHLACFLRSILGDVFHQTGECSCFGGDKHDEQGSYKEQSERALAAMVAAGRGHWVREQ